MNHTIGVTNSGYSTMRCVIALPYSHSTVVHVHDLCRTLSFINRRLGSPPNATSILSTAFFRPGPPSCDLLHLVNSVNFSGGRWITSFEHYLPRWNSTSKIGLRRLADADCKRIIAWSAFAFREQECILERFPDVRDTLRGKMTILHPAQSSIIRDYAQKPMPPDAITFAFVGRDFFRKGGLETLRAFRRIRDRYRHIRLTIVSSFDYGDYASQSTEAELSEARQLCEAMSDVVTVHAGLPNSQVLELLLRSHVALLPTYDDTYGFSVLEAQGAGCPVITTDVGTLPEINNESAGWLVRVPKDERGIAHRVTPQQRGVLSKAIEDGVLAALEDVCAHPDGIRTKGAKALERIIQDHSPERNARILEEIYDEALR